MQQWQKQGGTAPAPAQALRGMVFAYMPAQILCVAAKLGVADVLDAGPRSGAELAEITGTDPSALDRLLRALECFGVVTVDESGRVALGPMGGPLRADAPDSVRELVMHIGGEALWRSWGELMHGIRTGESAFRHVYRMDYFDYLADNPGPRITFNKAMGELTENVTAGIVENLDFSGTGTLVDVGGGNGTLIAAVLAANPGLRGILFDTATGVEESGKVLADAGVAERCDVGAGDFFESVPAGGDTYLLKSVLHDWDDERGVAILHSVAREMTPGGRLVLIEPARPADAGPGERLNTVVADLNMFVLNGGSERSVEEFTALFDAAGLHLRSVTGLRAGTHHHIIEAVLAS